MDIERDTVWKRIIELGNGIGTPTDDVDWDEIHGMQSERDKLIRQYFTVSVRGVATSTIAQEIQELLDIDNDIKEQWLRHKFNIGGELCKLNTFRRANLAYLENSK